MPVMEPGAKGCWCRNEVDVVVVGWEGHGDGVEGEEGEDGGEEGVHCWLLEMDTVLVGVDFGI